MRDDDLRHRYGAQFRWEEGMLVFRHRQRGLPVEVSEGERDRAIARFVGATHTVTGAGIAMFMISAIALNVVVPGAFDRVEPIVAAMVSFGALFAGAMRWAWNMPAQGWRSRDPVGERLSRSGALVMMVEHASWPRIAAGIVATLNQLLGNVARCSRAIGTKGCASALKLKFKASSAVLGRWKKYPCIKRPPKRCM